MESIESNALHAVIEGNLGAARRHVDSLLRGECRDLAEQAEKLAEIAWNAYQHKSPVNPAGEEDR